MTTKERAKDVRLRKLYGWTLEMWNELFQIQKGRCAICGRTPKKAGLLNTDHFHFKIQVYKLIGNYPECKFYWQATTVVGDKRIIKEASTREQVIELVREEALPFSVRGLLCPGQHGTGCNTKLGRVDQIQWLKDAIKYLEDPPAKKILNDPISTYKLKKT